MKLRDRRSFKQPELMIIPMIDIMFFLLVFFMLGTLYMVEQRSLPVKLPVAKSSSVDMQNNFIVTMKKDGSIYLEDKQAELSSLVSQAQIESRANPNLAIVIRADKEIDYGKVISVIDSFKSAGVNRFALATEKAGKADGS